MAPRFVSGDELSSFRIRGGKRDPSGSILTLIAPVEPPEIEAVG